MSTAMAQAFEPGNAAAVLTVPVVRSTDVMVFSVASVTNRWLLQSHQDNEVARCAIVC